MIIGDVTFSSKSDLPSARSFFGATAVGTKIYMIGGYTIAGTYLSKLDSYDTITNTWDSTTKTPMDRAGGRFNAVAVGNKIYVPAGYFWTGTAYAATTTLRIYDIDTNSWSKGTPLPAARYESAAIAVGNNIYVMGGRDRFGLATSSVSQYNTSSGIWTKKTNIPVNPAYIWSATSINSVIYILSQLSFYAYDTVSDTWTAKTPPPNQHNGSGQQSAIVAVGNKIYAFNDYGSGKFVDMYDSTTNNWSVSFFNADSVANSVAVAVSSTIYSLGGEPLNTTSKNTGFTIGQYNVYQKN
jgi:N-acetylneuraminic acid mutarotase